MRRMRRHATKTTRVDASSPPATVGGRRLHEDGICERIATQALVFADIMLSATLSNGRPTRLASAWTRWEGHGLDSKTTAAVGDRGGVPPTTRRRVRMTLCEWRRRVAGTDQGRVRAPTRTENDATTPADAQSTPRGARRRIVRHRGSRPLHGNEPHGAVLGRTRGGGARERPSQLDHRPSVAGAAGAQGVEGTPTPLEVGA